MGYKSNMVAVHMKVYKIDLILISSSPQLGVDCTCTRLFFTLVPHFVCVPTATWTREESGYEGIYFVVKTTFYKIC